MAQLLTRIWRATWLVVGIAICHQAGAQTLPDLTITKTHVGNFTQAQNGATYTITVSNNGAAPTAGIVTVADTLPASGLTATGFFGTGWSCSIAALTCTRSDPLAAGASYSVITLTVNVAPNAPASVTNSVTVTGGGETNTGNNSATDPTTINGGPDLTITKTHVGNFTQGQNGATYTITVSNVGVGPVSLGNLVTVADTLPASGLTATGFFGTGWSCSIAALTCTRSDPLAAGASYSVITLTVNVAPNAPASVTNSVTVTGGGETNTGNNSATDPTTINGGPDLTITKTHVGNFTQGQNGATYTITVSNVGVGPVSLGNLVTVADTLPASGLTATGFFGTGWSCSIAALTCTRSDPLAAGASYSVITLTVNVAPNAPASVTNSVTVTGGGETNTGNNSATDPTTINGGPDLTITKTHVGNFTQGQNGATYTITVSNVGVGPVSLGNLVTVADTLPASGLTATGFFGTGWSCSIAALTCTRSDPLAAGASYSVITLTVNVAPNAPASVTNSVTVTGGGETNTGNNSATDPTTINGGPDLTITKTHVGNFTQGQNGATYTITVSNVGVGPVSLGNLVTVADTLPASGLTATGFFGTGWSCSIAALTCTRSDPLAAGASYSVITLTVNVAPNAPASVTNSVTVTGGGETNLVNDTAADVTAIDAQLDTTITGNPPLLSNSPNATFSFTSTQPGIFECKLDGAAFAACLTPKTYTLLADGSHTFAVRALDGGGNPDPTPAQYSWTVDTTAPTLVITDKVTITAANQGAYAIGGGCSEGARTVNIQIGSLATSAICGVPTVGQFNTTPIDVTSLAQGTVSLQASMTDAAGNLGSVTDSTTKDTIGPTLTIDTLAIINAANAGSYGFSGTCEAGGSAVSYTLTSGAAVNGTTACSGGGVYAVTLLNTTTLSDGTVAFAVTQSDAVGNPSTQNGSVLKDTVNPTLMLNVQPPVNSGNQASYVVSGTCSEAGQPVNVSVTGVGSVTAMVNCGTPSPGVFQTGGLNLTSLPDGTLTIAAAMSDAVGNTANASTSVVKNTSAGPPPVLQNAKSRKVQGSAGTFDLLLAP